MRKKKEGIFRRIKDLPPDRSLRGVHFRTPDGVEGYWYSQWRKGVWCKKAMTLDQVFPVFLANLQEALEWEVIE